MSETFRWCFIGTGKLANIVAKELENKGGHLVVSVYSRRYEKAVEFAQKHNAKAYEDVREAIRDTQVDGVYVVTPHNAHYEYVKMAIEEGKPVLCEKAFTTDAKQAEELFDLAEKKGVYIAEAMWTWFSPVANQVKKWLDEGAYGKILSVKANYHLDVRNYAPRLTDPKLAGGMLLDSGVYPITYLYRLFGKPVKVVCRDYEIENGVDMKEEVDLTFENGKTYTASVSMLDNKGLEYIEIVGDKASTKILFAHAANKAVLKKGFLNREVFKGSTSYKTEFDAVAKEIKEGLKTSRLVPAEATLDIMRIMDECRKQMDLVYPFEKA